MNSALHSRREPASAARGTTSGSWSSWPPGATTRGACRWKPPGWFPGRPRAVCRGAPAQFGTVIGVVGNFEIPGALDRVLERERPRRAVAARIGKLAGGKLRGQHLLQFGFYFGNVLAVRHGITFRVAGHPIAIAAH